VVRQPASRATVAGIHLSYLFEEGAHQEGHDVARAAGVGAAAGGQPLRHEAQEALRLEYHETSVSYSIRQSKTRHKRFVALTNETLQGTNIACCSPEGQTAPAPAAAPPPPPCPVRHRHRRAPPAMPRCPGFRQHRCRCRHGRRRGNVAHTRGWHGAPAARPAAGRSLRSCGPWLPESHRRRRCGLLPNAAQRALAAGWCRCPPWHRRRRSCSVHAPRALGVGFSKYQRAAHQTLHTPFVTSRGMTVQHGLVSCNSGVSVILEVQIQKIEQGVRRKCIIAGV